MSLQGQVLGLFPPDPLIYSTLFRNDRLEMLLRPSSPFNDISDANILALVHGFLGGPRYIIGGPRKSPGPPKFES